VPVGCQPRSFSGGFQRPPAINRHLLSGPDRDEFASPDPEPAALLEVRERAREAAGRLAALKPQERRAIGLQAAGCSCAEIQAITGWTYTKVNRCMAEGRKAFLENFARIEAGEGR
jgi:DNA-directed RNA polymerase specialized sigma24 family protein